MVNRGIDRAVMRLGVTPEMGQERILAILAGPTLALHKDALRRCGLDSRHNYIDLRVLAKASGATRMTAAGLQSGLDRSRIASRACLHKGEPLVRAGVLAVVMLVVSACSSATPVPPSDPTASAAILKKDCSDPKWQQENLGLWYSVCRQPLRW